MFNTSERLCARASYKIFHWDSCVKGSWDFWVVELARKLPFSGKFFLIKCSDFGAGKIELFSPPAAPLIRISHQLFICPSTSAVWSVLGWWPHLGVAESNVPKYSARADRPPWTRTYTEPASEALGSKEQGEIRAQCHPLHSPPTLTALCQRNPAGWGG